MRIIKRGRRHIVISPSEPVDESPAQPNARSAERLGGRQVVRFDQLPADLQRVLQSRRPGSSIRAK